MAVDNNLAPPNAPEQWLAEIAAADADHAAGRLVDGAELHRHVQHTLARMAAPATPKPKRSA